VDSAVQAGRPGPSDEHVRGQLDLAERMAGSTAPPAVQALVLLRQAEEHAAAGQVDEALRYLERADTAWAATEGREDGLYGIGWSDGIQHAFRANVMLLAGRPADAVAILKPVLDAATGSNAVAAMTDLASAMARLGHPDHAAELLGVAWVSAKHIGLAERGRRIAGVRRRDLTGHEDVPAVRRLDEALAAK